MGKPFLQRDRIDPPRFAVLGIADLIEYAQRIVVGVEYRIIKRDGIGDCIERKYDVRLRDPEILCDLGNGRFARKRFGEPKL